MPKLMLISTGKVYDFTEEQYQLVKERRPDLLERYKLVKAAPEPPELKALKEKRKAQSKAKSA